MSCWTTYAKWIYMRGNALLPPYSPVRIYIYMKSISAPVELQLSYRSVRCILLPQSHLPSLHQHL